MWVIPIQKTLFPPSPGMRFWLVPLTLLPAGIHPVLLCPRGFRGASPSQRQLPEPYHPQNHSLKVL